jgi:predicted Zn finger-like uncharacterized protein
MSLTTRCPACATLFRVVPDQLKVSGGWVRCGRCADVFDARLSLSPPLPVVTEVVDPNAPPPQRVTVEVSHEVAAAPEQAPASPDPLAEPPNEAPPEPPTETPPTPPGEAVEPEATPQAASDAAPAPPLDQVSFVRAARRRAFWRRPAVRLALALGSVGLALALALQAVLHWRNALVLAYPGLQPALQALCIPLKCRIGPPRRIESITFEGSSFARVQPDVYRLTVTLANSARMPVAMPSLELTLTDLQDLAVLRRVLLPADYGPDTPASLPPGGEWSTTLTVAVTPGATPQPVVGYRLLAFYP